MTTATELLTRRTSAAADPEVLLGELQARSRLAIITGQGWRDAPPRKRGVVILALPGLPDDDGRVEWNEHELKYVSGRNLDGYLRALGVPVEKLSHVIIDGAIIRPSDVFTVALPETRWQRAWRGIRSDFRVIALRDAIPAPAAQLRAFDAFIPREGSLIHVVPDVEGKNASTYLGIVGAVIAVAAAAATGGASLQLYAQYAATGYAIGSMFGTFIAPRPPRIHDKDGPTSYMFGGVENDDRAGVPVEILLGERIAAGGRISAYRRRPHYVPKILTGASYDESAAQNPSERMFVLVRIAGHETEGPVGITDPNLPADIAFNKPDVRINGQHYAGFPGVEVEWRTGDDPQDVIPSFDVVANTYDVNVDLTTLGTGVWHTYTTISDEVDAFEVLLTAPGLGHATDKGLISNQTRYRLEYRISGSADPWVNIDAAATPPNIHAKFGATRTLVFETRRVQGLTRARYDIRVAWISATFTDVATDQWHLFLSGVTEETQEARSYDGDSLLAVRGIATEQLNGPMPTITVMWRGAKPQKWTSGGGFEAASWGVGSATPAGRNRGWLALWLIRNKRLGCGHEQPDAGINLPMIKAYADACDELETVTPEDGAPYTEPRFQLDAYINQQQPAVDLLQQLLGSARAALIFSGNKVVLGYNGPATVTQRFGMGNIRERSLRLQYRSERHEINTYDVIFEDRAADFDTDTVTVCIRTDETIWPPDTVAESDPDYALRCGTFCTEDELQAGPPGGGGGEPVKRRQLQTVGITRRSEAAREGRFALRTSYAIRTVGGFGASTDSMFCETFDVIEVSHDLTQWAYSGRVMPNDGAPPEIIASMVMFDRAVPLLEGVGYSVIVRFNTGDGSVDKFEERVVADTAPPADGSSYFGVTVTVPFSQIPQEGDLWFYGPTATKFKPFRILEISRDADCQREISIVEHNESIYATDGPLEIPNYSLLPNFSALPAPITNAVSFIETKTSASNGVAIKQVIVQATPPTSNDPQYGFAGGMRVEYGFTATGPWIILKSVDGFEFRWPEAPHNTDLYFRVTPRSRWGVYNYDGAFIITTPVNISDLWSRPITPQEPDDVTFGEHATPTKRRAVGKNGGAQVDIKKIFHVVVNFVFADAVNPPGTHTGFRVVVYPASGSSTLPHWEGEITATEARSIGVPDFEIDDAASYVAAVQATYVDGLKSNFATSDGLSLDPAVLEPLLQTGDDRNKSPYAEGFNRLVVPTGFTKAATDALSPNGVVLIVAPTNAASTFVQWNVRTWANAYLDALPRVSFPFVEVKLSLTSIATLAANADVIISVDFSGSGSPTNFSRPLIRDTKAHTYRFDTSAFQFNFSNPSEPTIRVVMSGVFAVATAWSLGGIAITEDDLAWEDDGWVYRGGKARDQFSKDAGGGYFGHTPLKLTNVDSTVTLVNDGGVFRLRSGGNTEGAYVAGFQSDILSASSNAAIEWASINFGLITPAIPQPVASNKCRVIFNAINPPFLDSSPLAYPVFQYSEATEIDVNGFRLNLHRIYGGSASTFVKRNTDGDWNAGGGASSVLTAGSADPAVNNGDAWFNFSGRAIPTSGGFRTVAHIAASMPLVKKSNGMFYTVDLQFVVYRGLVQNLSPLTLQPGQTTTGPYRMRVQTDGQKWRMAVVIARPVNSDISLQALKVDWYMTLIETGGGIGCYPTLMELDEVEAWMVAGGGFTSVPSSYGVIMVEEA